MSKDVIQMMISLGAELDEQQNAASDLWSWLPSHEATKKHHEDYVDNFTPAVKDIIVEASMYFAYLRDVAKEKREYTAEERDWFTKCACGEDHIPE
jgi:hypothetical protein